MIRLIAAALAALFLAAAPAAAQTLQQSGTVSPGHLGAWVTGGLVKDAGSPSNFQTNALGLYNGANNPFAISSQTAAGSLPATYCTLTLGATTTVANLTAQNQSGAGCPLNLNIGATTYTVGGTNWLSAIIDSQLGATPGNVLYRGASNWLALAPGNSGQVLQTLGTTAPYIQWAGSGGIGTVTSITAGTGLSGGTITTSGTISLTNPVAVSLGGTGAATLTAHNVLLGEGTSAVAFAAPGVAGTCLTSNGVAADPTFQSCPGTGTVTSISAGTGISVSPSPITSSGSVSFANVAADTILSNVTGGSTTPSANTPGAVSAILCQPQITVYTGGNNTYTTPTCNSVLPNTIEVFMVGGGGGGGGTNAGNTGGGTGGTTTFGTSLLTSVGGQGGSTGGGGAGGTTTGCDLNIVGNVGENPDQVLGGMGRNGGAGPLGGAGAGGTSSTGSNGTSGGGGGGAFGTGSSNPSGGGGSGGVCWKTITSAIAASYTANVGAGGSAGSAGAGGSAGGTGGAGFIRVTARWQ